MKSLYKTFLLLFLNVPFLVFNSFSQQAPGIEWQKSLGGTNNEFGNSVQQTPDGGYIVAGYSNSNNGNVSGNHGGGDYWIVKLNSLGAIQWQKSLGGTGDEEASSIEQTVSGGYIVTGYTNSNNGNVSGNHGGYDCWVVNLDNMGTIQWQKCLGGTLNDYGSSVQQTNDGGYIVSCRATSNNGDVSGNHDLTGTFSDYWIVKLDSAGLIEWQKCYGGTDVDVASSIRQTGDGGYIISGWTNSNDGDVSGNHDTTGNVADDWIVKIDSIGTIQWQKCLGGTGSDVASDVWQTADGGFAVGGYTYSNNFDVSGNHGGGDYWIAKLDASGGVQWQNCLGGTDNDYAYSMQQAAFGGYILAGVSGSNDGDVTGNHSGGDYWVSRVDYNGTLLWQSCLGGSDNDLAFSIQQTTDHGYIISGYSISIDGDVTGNHGGPDFWIVKLFPENVSSISTLQSSINNFQISPNPSSGIFQITFPSSSNQKTHYTLEVVNTLGQKVFTSPPAPLQRRGEFSTQLDVSFLPKGLYLLKTITSEQTFSKIIVIQ